MDIVRYFPAVGLLLLSLDANAVLIERDWRTANDSLLTYDPATNLEWLDVTVTAGLSYNQVNDQLGSGGLYEGFTFASKQQILSLFSAVDLQEIPNDVSTEGDKIQTLLSFWGVTWDLGTGERTEFLTANTTGLSPAEHWSGRVFWLDSGFTGVSAEMYVYDDNFTGAGIGSALVRVVPLPATGWLLASALLCLSGFRRRTTRH